MTSHYLKIHAYVAHTIFESFPMRIREIISHDADHKSYESREYTKRVNSEADRLYNDPDFKMNSWAFTN
jgi:hypothetical protein